MSGAGSAGSKPVARGIAPGHRRLTLLRGRPRPRRGDARAAPARGRRADRPERRGQDDTRQRHQRVRLAVRGSRRARGGGHHAVEPGTPRSRRARRGRSSTAARSGGCPCARTWRSRALGVGAGARRRAQRADELLEVLGLRERAEARGRSLPHGDERKLGVARALATNPRFVLMDEPAAGLPEAEVPDFAASCEAFATITRRACC